MAKDEWHNWARIALVVGTMLFSLGSGWKMISSNAKGVDRNEVNINENEKEQDVAHKEIVVKVEACEDDIHALQLNNKDLENITSATLDVLKEIKDDGRANLQEQMQIRIDVTQMKEQIKQWEPDDATP